MLQIMRETFDKLHANHAQVLAVVEAGHAQVLAAHAQELAVVKAGHAQELEAVKAGHAQQLASWNQTIKVLTALLTQVQSVPDQQRCCVCRMCLG